MQTPVSKKAFNYLTRIGLVFAFFASDISLAEEKFTFFQSTHTKGRGDTFAAAQLSHESGRLNPAALAENQKNKDFEITWWHMDIFVGDELADTITSLASPQSGKSSLESSIETVQEKFGKRHYIATQFLPLSFRFSVFEITPFVVNNSWTELRQVSSPVMSWKADASTGINIAAGFQVWGPLQLGFAVRPMARFYVAGEMYSTDILEAGTSQNPEFDDFSPVKTGSGIPGDIGLLYPMGKDSRFGLTWHNVSDATFSGGEDAPPPIRQRVSFGWNWRQKTGPWNLDYSFDLQDIVNRYALNYLRLIHTGVEWGRPLWNSGQDNAIGLQAGLSEGYPTAGLFCDLNWIRFDLSRYTVELGEYPGQRPDSRVAVSALIATNF